MSGSNFELFPLVASQVIISLLSLIKDVLSLPLRRAGGVGISEGAAKEHNSRHTERILMTLCLSSKGWQFSDRSGSKTLQPWDRGYVGSSKTLEKLG